MEKIRQKYPLFNLYLMVFINMVGFSMVFPLLPFYAQTFNASPLQIGMLAATHSFFNFLAAPIMGRVSDRFGRRPILAGGLILGGLSMSIMGLASSLPMLFASRMIHGVVASSLMPTARAYIGDVSAKQGRVAAMGKIGAAFSGGFLVGPAIASFLVGLGGIHLPFFATALVFFLNSISVYLWLPESLKRRSHNIVIKEGLLNVASVVKHIRGESGLLFLILFAWSFAMTNKQVSFPLLVEQKFNIGPAEIGYFFTAIACVTIVVQGFLLPRIIKLFTERWTIFFGLILMGISLMSLPFSPGIYFVTLSFMAVGLGSSLNRPTAEGILSRTSLTGQGTIMGLSQSVESLGRMMGPVMAGLLYESVHFTSPFILSGVLLIILAIYSLNHKFLKKAS